MDANHSAWTHSIRKWNNGLIALFVFILIGNSCNAQMTPANKRVLGFDSRPLNDLLRSKGFEPVGAPIIKRSADAWKLFVLFETKQGDHWIVTLPSGGKPAVKKDQDRELIMNSEGTVVGWRTPTGIELQNGNTVEVPKNGRFGFSPSGNYFFMTVGANYTAIFSSSAPEKAVFQLTEPFSAHSLFQHEDRVYLFGYVYSLAGRRPVGVLKGYIIERTGTEYRLERQLDLGWAGAVKDMDGNSDMILVEGKSDLFPRWWLYNFRTGRKQRLGFAKQYGYFLRNDVAVALERELQQKRR